MDPIAAMRPKRARTAQFLLNIRQERGMSLGGMDKTCFFDRANQLRATAQGEHSRGVVP